MTIASIGFGGGCHWCTEAVYSALRGVEKVSQGFISSETPHDTFSEAVVVEFDPNRIPLVVLIEIHLRTHASTSNHKMRGKYRSAIYFTSPSQAEQARNHLAVLQGEFEEQLVTQVLRLGDFQSSDEKFKNYYEKNTDGPFCTRYIDPKLDLLTSEFGGFVKSN